MAITKLQVGQVLRYSRDKDPSEPMVGGFTNYWHLTDLEGLKRPLMEAGINPIAALQSSSGPRRPAILISSSPHKVGSAETPWHDIFDIDNGRIRYFGDAKTPGEDPKDRPGNKALLSAFSNHSAIEPEERKNATPLLFFRRTSVNGVRKGYLSFQGFGVIERVSLISQFDARSQTSFTNYVYDFAVLSLVEENEIFDWAWINARRNPSISDDQCLKLAPKSWKRWIEGGTSALSVNRRQVSKLLVTKTRDQLPPAGSKFDKILREIYHYYDTKKHRFEGLAYAITRHLLSRNGGQFVEGWITPSGGDGGADFIGRLDIGSGFGAVRQIVYGQAKCVGISSGVDGKDIARTVARLKRGWFGVFVTTSYFSEPVQREVIEDEYPVLLVSGLSVAETTYQLMEEHGFSSVSSYLDMLDANFEGMKAKRRPEEILHG
jgi:hypothetical protein